MAKENAKAPPATVDAIEAWYREFFCDRQTPLVTEVQNEIRAAVDELKARFTTGE